VNHKHIQLTYLLTAPEPERGSFLAKNKPMTLHFQPRLTNYF